MTRILRLLLIAAVAWPMWQSAAAQEVKPEQTSFPKKLDVQEMKEVALLKEHHNAVPKSSASIKMLKASTKSETNSNSVDVLYGYTGTNRFIPVFGYFHDVENTISQMIYPASILQEAGLFIGDEITKLTFYTDDNGIKFSGGQLTFTIGETTTNVFSSNALMNVPTTNVTGTVVPTNGSTTLTVTFTTPFEYTGNNLFVQVVNTARGTCDDSDDPTLWRGWSNIKNSNNGDYYASINRYTNNSRAASVFAYSNN